MISRIEGLAAEVENDGVIVMVGGLGLKVFTPQPLLNEIEAGKPVALRTHLIVKGGVNTPHNGRKKERLFPSPQTDGTNSWGTNREPGLQVYSC